MFGTVYRRVNRRVSKRSLLCELTLQTKMASPRASTTSLLWLVFTAVRSGINLLLTSSPAHVRAFSHTRVPRYWKIKQKSVNILCLHSIQLVNMSPAYILLLHCIHKLKNEWTSVVWTVSSSAARLQDSSIRDKHVLYFQWRPYFIFVYLFYLFWVSDCVLCCKRAAVVMKRPHGNVWRMVTSAVRSWTWQADCKYTINNALTVDEWIMLSKDFTCKSRCIDTCFRF